MRSVVLAAVLVIAGVSGCSASEAEPAEVGPLASGTASASTSRTPLSAPPATAVPTGLEPGKSSSPTSHAADAAGASAFARDYIAAMTRALATGDSGRLRALSDPNCGGCSNVLAAIAQAAEAGHRVRGAELLVDFAEAPEVRAGETIVDLRYTRGAGAVVDKAGAVISEIAPEGPIDTQLRVRRVGSSWSVLGFRQTPQ